MLVVLQTAMRIIHTRSVKRSGGHFCEQSRLHWFG